MIRNMRDALAKVALCAAALVTLAACGSTNPSTNQSRPTATIAPSSSSTSNSSTTAGSSRSSTTSPGTSTGGPSTTTATDAFVPIVEPFDPGHPASSKPGPANCDTQTSTLDIEECLEDKTESADAAIDAVQAARYASASSAGRSTILAGDRAWLAARSPVCSVAFHSGGTIDGIDVATCLLSESTARLDFVKGITPAEAVLTSTDDPDASAIDWYAAPDGSRIGEVDTQGDQTGGVIIGWTIIGGAGGYVVEPGDFEFRDGTFVDAGLVTPASAVGHRVTTGVEYTFDIDYSTLSQDPHEASRTGGYTYSPNGVAVAVWK